MPEVLKTERMGHEVPACTGLRHASPAMRADLKAAFQERWEVCESGLAHSK
jgi:hypothetical protein